jgi:hypothetical protein
MSNYDATTFLADGKHMIENLATVMEMLMISALIVGLIVVVLLFWVDRSHAALRLGADPRPLGNIPYLAHFPVAG